MDSKIIEEIGRGLGNLIWLALGIVAIIAILIGFGIGLLF